MHAVHCYMLVLALLPAVGPAPTDALADARVAEDEKRLKAAGVGVDSPGLLEFFRKHTPTADTAKQVEGLLKQLGDKTFKAREQASADLIALGPPALPLLRQATTTGDLERQRRARHCLQIIEKRNAPEVVAAAARLLKVRRPAGACAALLKYLPGASEDTADEVLEAVHDLSGKPGQVDAAVAAALRDAAPERRAAAALVLGRLGTPAQRRSVRKLLADPNLTIRFRAAQGLLCGGDRSAVPALVGLLDKAPLPLAQQAEDLLSRVADKLAPKVSLGEDGKERAKARQAWDAWWAAHGEKLNLAQAGLQSPFADPAARARGLARRFIEAMMKGDAETARQALDAPFVIDPVQVFRTRAEVEQLFLQAVKAAKKEPYRILKTVRLAEYSKLAKRPAGAMQGVLASLPLHGEIRAVVVEVQQNGRKDNAALLVRVRGTRAWVVGIGILDPALARKK